MASGVISGFFRRARPGQPLRSLANVENLNKIANILNDLTGEGCWIEKPLDGGPWIVHISDDTSGEEPFMRRRTYDCQVDAENGFLYDSSEEKIHPDGVEIYVNGLRVSASDDQDLPVVWDADAGLKTLYIVQSFPYLWDADNQLVGTPYYIYTTDNAHTDYNQTTIARIPYCRVKREAANQPPEIWKLLEGPLRLYCYRGDADYRAFAETPVTPNMQKQTSKTIDNANHGLPVAVRNLDAPADGFFDEYPNGRYHIVTSQGVDTVEWYTAEEPEHTKNASKLLLLRYLYPQGNVPHGLPYWRTVAQFLANSDAWTEDHICGQLEDDKRWLISVLSPWAWEIWNENPGPYQPVLDAGSVEGVEIVAAVMDRSGHWHSVFEIVVSQDELDVTLGEYGDISDRVDEVENQAQGCVDEAEDAEDTADTAAQTIANFTDYSQNVGLVDGETGTISARVSGLATDFSDLDRRITALEQAV